MLEGGWGGDQHRHGAAHRELVCALRSRSKIRTSTKCSKDICAAITPIGIGRDRKNRTSTRASQTPRATITLYPVKRAIAPPHDE